MANLLVEYNKRHNINCILPTNDAVVFFNRREKPALICNIGTIPKMRTICDLCYTNNDMIIETFIQNKSKGHSLLRHSHISPNDDVVKHINRFNEKMTPVKLKNNEELESWAWEFFANVTWDNRSNKSTREQMFYCATYDMNNFMKYYTMYQRLCVGKKYLLFGDM